MYKDNKGRIGNYFLPACAAEVEAIDREIEQCMTILDRRFFDDVRSFNQRFASTQTDESHNSGHEGSSRDQPEDESDFIINYDIKYRMGGREE